MRKITKKEIEAARYLKARGFIVVSPEEQPPIPEESGGEGPALKKKFKK